jgi:hypothetical protein
MFNRTLIIILLAGLLAIGASLQADAQQPSSMGPPTTDQSGWTFNVAPYVWMATIDGNLNFKLPPPLAGTVSADPSIGFGNLLSHLNFATMVAADARYDRFSLLTDFIYFNLGGTASHFRSINAFGQSPVPVSGGLHASENMKVTAAEWTLAGGYTLMKGDWGNFDMIAGLRLIEISSRVNYSLGLTVVGPAGNSATFGGVGSVALSGSVWNGVGGFRGHLRLGDTGLFIPYYFDAGAGGSKLTWQIASGLGYHTRLADVSLTYRYLTWQQSDSFEVERLSINGPMLAVNFTF